MRGKYEGLKENKKHIFRAWREEGNSIIMKKSHFAHGNFVLVDLIIAKLFWCQFLSREENLRGLRENLK